MVKIKFANKEIVQKAITEYNNSKLTRAEICKKYGISEGCFKYHNYEKPKQKNNSEEEKVNKKEEVKVKVRKSIPKIIKNKVWNIHVGKDNGIGKCYACNENEIDSKNFECGHVVSVKNGGDNSITNLRPICSECNKSMGIMNLEDYKIYVQSLLN